MKRNRLSYLALTILAAVALTAAGCSKGTNNNEGAATPVPEVSTAPTLSPEPSEAPSPSPSPEVEPTLTEEPQATTAPAASPAGTATVNIKELMDSAKKGMVPGIPYAAHKTQIDEVKKDWGQPDTEESVGNGIYATYSKKNAVIGFNKGSQVIDVRSNAPELQTLTLKQIEDVLGKPSKTTKNGDDTIYTYAAGKTYELRFIVSGSTGKVDHISVLSPADVTGNNMAQ